MTDPNLQIIEPPYSEIALPDSMVELAAVAAEEFVLPDSSLESLAMLAGLMRNELTSRYANGVGNVRHPVAPLTIKSVASELLSNTVRYSGGPQRVFVGIDPSTSWTFVGAQDGSPFWVKARGTKPLDPVHEAAYSPSLLESYEHNRGMLVVEAVSKQVAFMRLPLGKIVWANLG